MSDVQEIHFRMPPPWRMASGSASPSFTIDTSRPICRDGAVTCALYKILTWDRKLCGRYAQA